MPATAVFIPFEVVGVVRRVTVLRVLALLVNLAIVVYLAPPQAVRRHVGGPSAPHAFAAPAGP